MLHPLSLSDSHSVQGPFAISLDVPIAVIVSHLVPHHLVSF